MDPKPNSNINIPVISLIAANLVPLFGVLFADWSLFAILILFWSENIILGFYNILKMASVKTSLPALQVAKFFMIPFFAVHYGGFCLGHGMFILIFFNKDKFSFDPFSDISWPNPNILFGVAALFVSHGVSFFINYIIKGERTKASLPILMFSPYARIVILHIAIVFGGIFVMVLNSPVFMLVILIILKIGLDIALHRIEHIKYKGPSKNSFWRSSESF